MAPFGLAASACSVGAAFLVLALVPARAAAHNGAVAVALPVGPITVDGDRADWPESTRYPIDAPVFADLPTDAADLQGGFRVGYDPTAQALYLSVELQDQSVVVDSSSTADWNTQDGVEVYLEESHTEAAGSVGQYAVRGRTPRTWGQGVRLQDLRVAVVPGRRSEWRLALHRSLRPGTVLALDAYPLGVRPDTVYQTVEVRLKPDDYLVLYSDGIAEAANGTGELFGFDRAVATVRDACARQLTPDEVIDHLIAVVRQFAAETAQGDDITCVVVRLAG